MITEQRQNLLEKWFIIIFALVNGSLVIFPGIYSTQFKTIFDLSHFALEKGVAFHSPTTLIIWSSIILISSLTLLISVPLKIRQQRGLVWEWYVYLFLNLFVLDVVAIIYDRYFEAAGLKSLGEKIIMVFIIVFAIQLLSIIAFLIVQGIRAQKTKGEMVSGVINIEETIKLASGEHQLYKIHASVFWGHTGILTITSERIFFSGKNVFTNKSLVTSIPFKKIVGIKKPRKLPAWLWVPALKIWFINEKGIKKKITFGAEGYNFDKNHILEIHSLFSFLYHFHSDKELQGKVKHGEQVTIVEPGIKERASKTSKYAWIHILLLIVALAGGVIPVLVVIGLSHLILWLINKYSKS